MFIAAELNFLLWLSRSRASLEREILSFGTNQLKRAALSIPLNIAEASGKVGTNDRARFFAIAKGSTMECGAILDCIEIINPCCQEEISKSRILIQRIVEMLSKLCRSNS